MKIRKGFVSNSSSSSFIVHKLQMSEEKWEELKNLLNEIKEEQEQEQDMDYGDLDWSGNGFSFYDERGFLEIGTKYLDEKYLYKIESLLEGIYPDNVYHIEG